MRVLVIAKEFPAPQRPTAGVFVLRQMQALARLGHEVRVVVVVPHAPPWTLKWRAYRSIPDRYSYDGLDVTAIRAFFPPRMIGMEYLPLQVGSRLRRIASDFAPHVVHAHSLIPSGQLASCLDVPTVLTAHGSDAYDWPWRRAGLRRAAVQGVKSAGAVVAVSDFIRGHVRSLVARDVAVVYNGADERVFLPSDRIAARRELGIAPNRFVIAFVGRPAKEKGAFELVAATSGLRAFNPLLLLAGPDGGDPELGDAIRRRQVDARVLGMVEHGKIAQILAASDVFCMPSYSEGLPVAVCEAMLAGKPIVTTPVGGIPEIVRDRVHGYLVPPRDATVLELRLRALAGNPALALLMGSEAHRFAQSQLTWQANARAYDKIYERLLENVALRRKQRAPKTGSIPEMHAGQDERHVGRRSGADLP